MLLYYVRHGDPPVKYLKSRLQYLIGVMRARRQNTFGLKVPTASAVGLLHSQAISKSLLQKRLSSLEISGMTTHILPIKNSKRE